MEEKYDLSSQQQMTAEKHPKAWDPLVLLLCIPLGLGGAIIGMELIVRTGVTANTSIIGALFAILSHGSRSVFSKNTAVSTDRIFCRHPFRRQHSPLRTA